MNKNKRIVIGAGLFVLSVGVGFFVANLFSGKKELVVMPSPPKKIEYDTTGGGGGKSGGSEPTPIPPAPPEPAPKQEKTEIIVQSLERSGNTYSLVVKCEHVPDGVSVKYKIIGLDKESETGEFDKIPGIASGKYTVVALNKEDETTLARKVVSGFDIVEIPQVVKMSAGEFQALLNQGDESILGGGNLRVAKYVALSFIDLNDGDFTPDDILSVQVKIANRIWRSVTVVSVRYNERGQINAATIRPIY